MEDCEPLRDISKTELLAEAGADGYCDVSRLGP